MKWVIAAIGKPRLDYARLGMDEYLKRTRHFAEVEILALRSGAQAAEGQALLERTTGCHRIVMDERGDRLTSRQFSQMIAELELAGTRRAAVLVGGADGHSAEVRAQADRVLSLSSLTLQHELALVVLLEQIYRGYSILRGTPYHRD
ncbi:MAG TPA: 23S rRNA (pseudouridine(1915)-N(3))-methyltransferase RlmH [Chthoniobacterales bacterium]|jgi:23S rRNA (pseudouridine1915-N3)-methyltransferase